MNGDRRFLLDITKNEFEISSKNQERIPYAVPKKRIAQGAVRFFDLISGSSALFAAVGKFVNFEFYYKITSYFLIESILVGERKKRAPDAFAKQTVHSNFVPFTWLRYFYILDFFLVF